MTTDEWAVVACWANATDAQFYPDMVSVAFARWNCRHRRTCTQGELCRRFQERHGGRAVSVAKRGIEGEVRG